jgi:hypothetical protein
MRGLNHLVLTARNLDEIRSTYEGLGFTLTPSGQHPFGTGNAIVQLHGTYLELLAVTRPFDIVEHTANRFSFSAFNRDYLERHEGFSMMVFDSADAHSDIAEWKNAGLRTYDPFEFARQAKLPDGSEVTVGFSLAFVSNPAAPWLGVFACQHFRPDYYAQPRYLSHPNGAQDVREVWISGDGAGELEDYMIKLSGSKSVKRDSSATRMATAIGTIVLSVPDYFEQCFGCPPPHQQDGPHLAGFVVGCRSLAVPHFAGLATIGGWRVVPSSRAHETAIAFTDGTSA